MSLEWLQDSTGFYSECGRFDIAAGWNEFIATDTRTMTISPPFSSSFDAKLWCLSRPNVFHPALTHELGGEGG